jgi:phosphatidylglycerol:prolipoprotein diacylglycerol transferase
MALEFPNIDPVALALGPVEIRWYALAYLAGFILGWRYALYLAGRDADLRPSREDVDDFLPWAVLGVILGGRLGYVLFYQSGFYLENPLAILQVWKGGMSFHGGALGVIFALFVYPYLKKFPMLRLADIVCAAVPIGLFFGRIANFVNGELYGRVTDVSWGIVFPGGGPEPRHPSQLYEAALEGALLFLILFAVIRSDRLRNMPGLTAGLFLAGYGLFRGFVEFFREPDAHLGFVYEFLSMGQLLSLPMILAGAGLAVYAVVSGKAKHA